MPIGYMSVIGVDMTNFQTVFLKFGLPLNQFIYLASEMVWWRGLQSKTKNLLSVPLKRLQFKTLNVAIQVVKMAGTHSAYLAWGAVLIKYMFGKNKQLCV